MQELRLHYVNWKGEKAVRRLIPHYLFWGSTSYHPEAQWLVEAWDTEKSAWRTFALSGFKWYGRIRLRLHFLLR